MRRNKHRFTLFCQYSSADSDGRHNFIGVHENLTAVAEGSPVNPFFLAIGFLPERRDRVRIRWVSERGDWTHPDEASFEVAADAKLEDPDDPMAITAATVTVFIPGLVFPAYGRYCCEFHVNERLEHTLLFGVKPPDKQK